MGAKAIKLGSWDWVTVIHVHKSYIFMYDFFNIYLYNEQYKTRVLISIATDNIRGV